MRLYFAIFSMIVFCCSGFLNAQVSMFPGYGTSCSANHLKDSKRAYSYTEVSAVPLSSMTISSALKETSGCIHWNNRIWTHNDNTDTKLYSLDTINGKILQTIDLPGTINTDWEEISQDNDFIYIGDFGNNSNGNRRDLRILRIEKNSVIMGSPVIDEIRFSYSNQVSFTPTGSNNTDFDCEAFIVTSDSIFLFTKQWISGMTSLYSLSKTPGTYIAKLRSTLDVDGLVTGATFLMSKRIIALCGYNKVLEPFIYLLYDFNDNDFFNAERTKVWLTLQFHQAEGIATHDGLRYYITNEFFSQSSIIVEQKLHIFDLTTVLESYFNTLTDIQGDTREDVYSVYPVPCDDLLYVGNNASGHPFTYLLTNLSGQVILRGNTPCGETDIDLSHLSPGIYILVIDGNGRHPYMIVKR